MSGEPTETIHIKNNTIKMKKVNIDDMDKKYRELLYNNEFNFFNATKKNSNPKKLI